MLHTSLLHISSPSIPRRKVLAVLPPLRSFWGIQASAVQQPPSSVPEVVHTEGVPVYLYARKEEVEREALTQLINLAESPLPEGFVAAMPDVHVGKGIAIGTVFASSKYICPNAVGVDIGCGVCAIPIGGLYREDLSPDKLAQIQRRLKQLIPTGFSEHKSPLPRSAAVLEEICHDHEPSPWILSMLRGRDCKAAKQLGTLGGGNHFLEVVHDETGQVWAMLHSGSRNIGNETARRYDRLAQQWMAERSVTPPAGGLNYIPVDSEAGRRYLADMEWCQRYALENRRAMMGLVLEAVAGAAPAAAPEERRLINVHHNYCECRRCRYTDPRTGRTEERDLWVTRKGATSAAEGQLGIIPGSMGVGSYVTLGRGNPNSWSSCSHGAGRRMSRTRAANTIQQDEFEAAMKGIVCDTDPRVIDEAPQAYKDLDAVMRLQQSLVDIKHRLTPLINVKGFGKVPKRSRRSG